MKKLLLVLIFVLTLQVAFGAQYYMSPTGSDTNNGTSTGTAWLTPNHALNCGDVITAASGAYTGATNWTFGTVTCAAGNNVAWIICATPFACTESVTSGGQYAAGMTITQSYWGVQGFQISTAAAEGQCFAIAPPNSTTSISHVIYANNIANGCGKAGFEAYPSGSAGVDYIAFIGNIAYGASTGTTECESGINIFNPVATDTLPGTHYYFAGNFAFDNVNPGTCASNTPGTDGEGLFFDTVNPYAQQMVMDNNLAAFNGGNGIKVYNNTTGPAHVYFRHNTTFGDETGGVNGGICAENAIQSSYTTESYFNLAVTNSATGCNGAVALYALGGTGINATDIFWNNYGYSAAGNNISASGATIVNNTYSNPSLASPTNPSAPSCGAFATTAACMATVIANFKPAVTAAQPFGYQQPGSSSIYDPLYPQWLCNVTLPTGLVTPGCLTGSSTTGASLYSSGVQ